MWCIIKVYICRKNNLLSELKLHVIRLLRCFRRISLRQVFFWWLFSYIYDILYYLMHYVVIQIWTSVFYFILPIIYDITICCLSSLGFCYQIEIINDLPADKTITVYRCGPLVDLCRGPHIPNTSFVKAIACLKVSVWSFL